MTILPTQSNVLAALRSFLSAALPGIEVIAGQPNRVPEPSSQNFVVITPLRLRRLRTNEDTSQDVKFSGTIDGTALTVTHVPFGVIKLGATVFGVGVAANTTITAFGSGAGGAGTYTVSPNQTIGIRTLSSGAKDIEQGAEVTVQCDFHSADFSAGDMAQTVSTLFRDEFATTQFAEQVPNYGVVPLYADDPRQMPWQNEQQQIEWRWVLEAVLQVNDTLSTPLQYADALEVDVISVDEAYAP